MSFDNILFSATIQARLLARHLTLNVAAKESGISMATLSRVTHGGVPDIESFAKLIKWLGVDANAFLDTPPGIPVGRDQWVWLYACLQSLDVPKELIEAIIVIVKRIQKRESEGIA